MHNKLRGFTLLEMVIVILIISILFLLVVPNIQKTLTIVNNKGCKALEKIVDSAILQYKIEHDRWPNSTADLVNDGLLSKAQLTCDGSKQVRIVNGQAKIQ